MNTKKQVARKLIETILFNYTNQLFKSIDSPIGVIQYFETAAILGKFDRELITKAVQYFIQLSFRFEVTKTNLLNMCIALEIPNSLIYKVCSASRSRVCDTRRNREKIHAFLEQCQPAQFAYETDKTLAEYFRWLLELGTYPDAEYVQLANLIKEILEGDNDEYLKF